MKTRLPLLGPEASTRLGTEASTRRGKLFGLAKRPKDFSLTRLSDRQGRRYHYLRLSVTDRCDFACEYCMPPGGETEHDKRSELLTFEEASRVVGVFHALGVQRVRFTGGEPFVRKHFVSLVQKIGRDHPNLELALTTNAHRLEAHLDALKAAGLVSLNISIDSLDADRFARITRGGSLAKVRAGIERAVARGFDVKLNIVPMIGPAGNQDEWVALTRYAWSLGIVPRFIELMPLGEGKKVEDRRVSTDIVERVLDHAFGLGSPEERGSQVRGPAYYRQGPAGRVGFISALSGGFCDSCNRVRVTARGDIHACLADRQALSLRDIMRSGGSDADLGWALHQALDEKKLGHAFLDHEADEHEHVGMSLIGG